jgi:polygalacturonase
LAAAAAVAAAAAGGTVTTPQATFPLALRSTTQQHTYNL